MPQHPPASGGGSGRWWSAGGPRLAAAGSRRRAESPRSRRCAGGVRSRHNTRRRSLANRTATAYADTRTARCEPMRDMVAHLSALRLASVSAVSCSAVSMVANVRLHAAQQLRRLCRPDAGTMEGMLCEQGGWYFSLCFAMGAGPGCWPRPVLASPWCFTRFSTVLVPRAGLHGTADACSLSVCLQVIRCQSTARCCCWLAHGSWSGSGGGQAACKQQGPGG